MFCTVKVNQWDFFSGGNSGRGSGGASVWALHTDVLSLCLISAAYLSPRTCRQALHTHGIEGGRQVHACPPSPSSPFPAPSIKRLITFLSEMTTGNNNTGERRARGGRGGGDMRISACTHTRMHTRTQQSWIVRAGHNKHPQPPKKGRNNQYQTIPSGAHRWLKVRKSKMSSFF